MKINPNKKMKINPNKLIKAILVIIKIVKKILNK